MPPDTPATPPPLPEVKKCPFCAEEVRLEAIKCKHCGSSLAVPPPPALQSRRIASKPARINRRQRTLIWLAVGLFAIWLIRSCYVEVAKLSAPSLTDMSALSIALINGGIDVMNGILSPSGVFVIFLFLLFFELLKTRPVSKPNDRDSTGQSKSRQV